MYFIKHLIQQRLPFSTTDKHLTLALLGVFLLANVVVVVVANKIYLISDRVLSGTSLMVMVVMLNIVAPSEHHWDRESKFAALLLQVLNLEVQPSAMESNLSLNLSQHWQACIVLTLFNLHEIVQLREELNKKTGKHLLKKQKHFTDRQSAVTSNLDSTVGTGEDNVAPVFAVSEGHWTWRRAGRSK